MTSNNIKITRPSLEVGITVLPEYLQSDGVDQVVSLVADVAGASSVTTSPYVVAQSDPLNGYREPPIDGGAGKGRLLDRPLWGKREVWMTTSPSFTPNAAIYEALVYKPPQADELTIRQGRIVGDFLTSAKLRGLETWMQIMAAIPPCHRVQFGGPLPADEALLPDGTNFNGRVDNNASLASEDLRAYVRAIISDLCKTYPQVDGFKFDWPEYPAYHFEALFFDFNPACARYAEKLGLNFEKLRKGVLAFLRDLGEPAIRHKSIALDSTASFMNSLLGAYPILADLIALKTTIVEDYAIFLRNTVSDASNGSKAVFLQCFPPPLNIVTGFDFARIGPHCDMIGVKYYTMHWPMIEKHFLEGLRERTNFSPPRIARALSAILGLSGDVDRRVEDIRYPEPDDSHPATSAQLTQKMMRAKAEVPSTTRICGITHAYGPIDDVMRRFDAIAEGSEGLVHVNRCGYLSDAKLEAIGRRTKAASGTIKLPSIPDKQ